MNQHKAAKATNIYPKKGFYDSFSISRLLSELNWKPLEERRTQARLCMVSMIINNLVILDPSYVRKPSYTRPSRHCSETKIGSANRLAEKLSRVKVTSNTFFNSAPKLWNRLASQAKATSIESFKNYINI